jgi:hypothetical protein
MNDPEQRNIPEDTKPITMLDYTIKITEELASEWLQEKNYAAGQPGTEGTTDTDNCKYPRKLPG